MLLFLNRGAIITRKELKFLSDPGYVFITALILGLIFGGIPYHPETIALICLMVAMSLSTTRVELREAFALKKNSKPLLTIFLIHFGILTTLILVLGAFFDFSWEIWTGIVVMAAVPPAVAVIPYTEILKGDTELTVGASAALYIASIGVTPLIILLFLGTNTDIRELVKALILMIIIPLIISRILRTYKTDEKLGNYKPIVVNLSFAVLFFTVVGVNRSVFFENLQLVLALVLISIIRTMVIGSILFNFLKKLKVEKRRNITFTLFSAYKNLALAVVLAFGLFGPIATIPATICIPFEIIAFVYFKKLI